MGVDQGVSAPMVAERSEARAPSITELLRVAIDRGGSDLHLMAGSAPFIRLHGDLVRLDEYPVLTRETLRTMVYGILPDKLRERFEQDLELDTSYSLPGRARFRVNVYQQRDSLGAVFRLIPSEIKSVEQLGLPPVVAELARFAAWARAGDGADRLGQVDDARRDGERRERGTRCPHHDRGGPDRVPTHEQAVRHQPAGGRQATRTASPRPPSTCLRQDPDVILVGEMRDLETISTAITAAETGHLVFATLHTQDAPQTIDRVIDVFPSEQQQQIRVQLSTTLQGVVSQQLVPSADGQGRVVAAEVLVVTPAVRAMIREGRAPHILGTMQTGGTVGMVTMDAALAKLVKAGRITHEAALDRCHDPKELQRLLGPTG